ncbi:MAG: hypothetical protein CMG64_07640 [Candidatus Marinimicrobia bacterium]|nr:hypothetical protein [Candidatus Neomarinimicrobiota bacterium]|tara:strand:+ start:1760 stop:2896 length:1137 start_codon:yes stop_codon:yes gene_type:complete
MINPSQLSRDLIGSQIADKKLDKDLIKKNIVEIMDYAAKNRLLYRIMSSLDKDLLIELKLLDHYKGIEKISIIRHMNTMFEIRKIAKIFNESGARYVFLKGSYYKLLILEEPEKRYCDDIDILIDKNQVRPLTHLLLKEGYRFKRIKNPQVNNFQENWSNQLPTIISPSGIPIDIHHRISCPRAVEEQCKLSEILLDESKDVYYKGVSIKIPAWEHAFLHLIYNALNQDLFSLGPLFLYDLKDMLNFSTEITDLEELAEELGCKDELDLSLSLLKNLGYRNTFYFNYTDTKKTSNVLDLILLGKKISNLSRSYKESNLLQNFISSTNQKYLTGSPNLKNIHLFISHFIFKAFEISILSIRKMIYRKWVRNIKELKITN